MAAEVLQKIIDNIQLDKGYRLVTFAEFLSELTPKGETILRNIFQLFHDMVHFYVREEPDEMFEPESMGLHNFNFDGLFIKDTDKPFFADRLFSNRLMNLANSFRLSAARNKIYLFKGPAGSGKSTFLNNLLAKLEAYVREDAGLLYEVVWRIPPDVYQYEEFEQTLLENDEKKQSLLAKKVQMDSHPRAGSSSFEVPCPSHDNPFLMIPRPYRYDMLKSMIPEGEFKRRLFKHKQYQWVFKDDPCTICSSIFNSLLERFPVQKVFSMIHARRHFFDRRQSTGISVFNSGDEHDKHIVRTNEQIQTFLNEFFQNSHKVKYLYSGYANTNQGIMALMDLKARNVQRFLDLHGIISDEVHKVQEVEERVKSLFIVLMNPGDLENIGEVDKKRDASVDLSLKDRIHEIMVPYVLDFNTEIKIYINTFGDQIKLRFMPHVLENFAKTIISSRIKSESRTISDWIDDDSAYQKYCDPDFFILKMYLYSGIIPDWLTKEDKANFKPEIRKNILAESEHDGHEGFSGRESNQIFDEFYSKHSKKRPITMRHVLEFFMDENRDFKRKIPRDFLKHLTDLYDFMVLKEVKDSMYDYNEEEISKTILNYLVAILHNVGDTIKNVYLNNEELVVTEDFLDIVETHLIGHNAYTVVKERYRREAIEEYASLTLAKEIKVEGKKITETKQFKEMFAQFTKTARQNILEPFAGNTNFRNAILEFGTEAFEKYEAKIRQRVKLLFSNLREKYDYQEDCARTVAIYVLDNKLHEKFET